MRWLNCDPIGEKGGINLYQFVSNDPIDYVDILGLSLSGAAGGFIDSSIFGPQNFANNVLFPALGLIEDGIDSIRHSDNPVVRVGGGWLWGGSMVWGGPELKAAREAKALEDAARLASGERLAQLELPLANHRPGNTGKKAGVLCDKKGNQFSLKSGRNGPAENALKGPGSGFDLFTSTHVEGHAAALMDQLGINEATLHINNPEICPNCSRNLPSMLQSDSKLTVVLPDGTPVVFVGK